MDTWTRVLLLLSVTGMAASTVAQPIGPVGYWLAAGDQNTVHRVDDLFVNTFTAPGGHGYPIAVFGDVRTAGAGAYQGDYGAQYTLAGTPTGVTYNEFLYDPDKNNLFYDGATDGTFNYVVSYGNGNVYKTARDWTNKALLFNAGTPGSRLGITWDDTDNSLWIADWSGSTVWHYSMGGSLMGSFTTGETSLTCLALDYKDETLWIGSRDRQGSFFNYSKSGALIRSIQYSALQDQNTLGGEFEVVPEPASLALLGVALASLTRRRPRA